GRRGPQGERRRRRWRWRRSEPRRPAARTAPAGRPCPRAPARARSRASRPRSAPPRRGTPAAAAARRGRSATRARRTRAPPRAPARRARAAWGRRRRRRPGRHGRCRGGVLPRGPFLHRHERARPEPEPDPTSAARRSWRRSARATRVRSSAMAGAIAAGQPLTAQAGAAVLASGGNAVDACVAAAFVAFVVEGPLAGPAGGGFLLLHEPHGATRLLDCFFAAPA